ncbi:MAG TPA: transcriptional regulator [Rhodobacteraceae bacterium]|jgi:Lrp/AsnC family transcriptional regulator|nr:transcriptional regulator [Paracoccaceae bacterium]|tara:strand:- start:335 stop:799 length:465 start_codon:yes stop_codon:yes gene_type:complete
MTTKNLDNLDKAILRALQQDSSLSQRELAEKVGLSQNSCWRRLTRLREQKIIKGQTVRLDMTAVGLSLTVFVMVRTRHHSAEWLKTFRKSVLAIDNVIDFYRIAGDYDYMIKIVARDMNDFDQIYQRIISQTELETVTSYIAMEAIADGRNVPA